MAIGTAWVDGSWVDAGWAANAWSDAVAEVTPAAAKGHISRGKRRPRVVYVDQPEPEREDEITQRRLLRMTPEVRRMIDRYKKQAPRTRNKGLL